MAQVTFEVSPTVIIGSGLIGASIGCALTAAGVTVALEDQVATHLAVAENIGAGSSAALPAVTVRMVVVAVPPAVVAATVLEALDRFPNAVVTDVSSIKGTVLAALRQAGADLDRYVGSHPMAGAAQAGPLSAHAQMFVDRTWVICPHDTAKAQSVFAVEKLARLCGARIVTLGATHHDEAVAQVSHLPHLMSVLVAGHLTEIPPGHLVLAGQGLRDVTRIAGSDPSLWQQIIAANGAAVRNELVELHHDLSHLISIIDDPSQVSQFLARGRDGRKSLPGKHGTVTQDFGHVVVEIPDAPGSLARLFTTMESAGINVEDVAIEHDTLKEVGYLSVQVAHGREAELAAVIVAAGWTIRR